MNKYYIKIRRVHSEVLVEVDADNETDAVINARHMLYVGDGVYSDIDEANFKEPENEYVFDIIACKRRTK